MCMEFQHKNKTDQQTNFIALINIGRKLNGNERVDMLTNCEALQTSEGVPQQKEVRIMSLNSTLGERSMLLGTFQEKTN